MALSELQVMNAWASVLTGYKSTGERIFNFARAIEAEVRKDDEALIRQLVEALSLEVVEWEPGFLAGAYDSNEPRENVARAKILAALKASRARLEKAP